jgi:hypothetical protein
LLAIDSGAYFARPAIYINKMFMKSNTGLVGPENSSHGETI